MVTHASVALPLLQQCMSLLKFVKVDRAILKLCIIGLSFRMTNNKTA